MSIPKQTLETTTIESSPFSDSHYQALAKNLGRRGLLDTKLSDSPNIDIDGTTYRLIGPTSPIDHGAVLDIGFSTATTVDFDQDTRLQATYQLLIPAFERIREQSTRQEGLTGLTTLVDQLMPYDETSVVNIYHDDNSSGHTLTARPIGEFIDKKIALCEQQALLTAALLEHAIQQGVLPEDFTARYHSIHDTDAGEVHAFATLRTPTKLWKLDPTLARDQRATIVSSY